jgi:general secretion pathway protein C
MSARWGTFGVWALVAASALFWGFRLFVVARTAPPQTQLAAPGAGVHGDLTRLLGADAVVAAAGEAPQPAPDARYTLVGVVSPRPPQAAREGLALIAVDGKPAKAFRVGAAVDGQNVLQAVSARSATLGPRGGAALIALNIAPPQAAAVGVLPPAPGAAATAPAPLPGGPPLRPNSVMRLPGVPQSYSPGVPPAGTAGPAGRAPAPAPQDGPDSR